MLCKPLFLYVGMGEINAVQDRLQATQQFRDGAWWVVPLHSSVDSATQRTAFHVPPSGVRKIVLATNIAETSLTIPDVVCVVDSGKLKVRAYCVVIATAELPAASAVIIPASLGGRHQL